MSSDEQSTPRNRSPPLATHPLPANILEAAASPMQTARFRAQKSTPYAYKEAVFDSELGECLVQGQPRRAKATLDEGRSANDGRLKLMTRDGSLVWREYDKVVPYALMLVVELKHRKRWSV